MADGLKNEGDQEVIELAETWMQAVISGDKEKSKRLAARIKDARESRLAIIAAVSRRIGALGQSFSSLVGGLAGPDPELSPMEEYQKLLLDFQKNVSWASPPDELEHLKSQILRFPAEKSPEEKETDIQEAERQGKLFKDQDDGFQALLKYGPFSNRVFDAYQAIPDWYKKKAEKRLTQSLIVRANRLSGDAGELEKFISRAKAKYPFSADALSATREELEACRMELSKDGGELKMPEVFSGAEHRLNFLPYSPAWTAYIDETGLGFNPAAGAEAKGKLVAVLVPEGLELPPIAPDFHAASRIPNIVLNKLNSLLALPVGLLGFSARSLHGMSGDEWFQNIRELLDWIWRLLPPPDGGQAPVRLEAVIENRGSDTPDKNLDSMARAINQDWDKENPERRKGVELGALRFAPKGEPGLAWADVAAYAWGASKPEIKNGLRQSGLPGICYFDVQPGLMRLWEKGWGDRDLLTGPEWQSLMEEKDADRRGSLTRLALEPAKRRCRTSPDLTRGYIEALGRYLDGKKYDLKILERQINWLKDLINDENIPPDLVFYWELAKLAHHNHSGDFSSEAVLATRKKLGELLPGMAEKDPQAAVQARLRLAVTSFNAYDFAGARDALTDYDPARGGRLPDDGLSAGKILSSLGQVQAFQGHARQALALFDQAAEAFSRLTRLYPDEEKKQKEQTGIYAAIAAMDDPDTPEDEKRRRVEQALDATVSEAAREFARGAALNESRYRHHLFARYLASFGGEEEKKAYLAGARNWLVPGLGLDTGHPWYLIQYYRWLMLSETEPRDQKLCDQVRESIFEDCLPGEPGLTVDLIGLTLEAAAGRLKQSEAVFQSHLARLKEAMPKASPWLEALAVMALESGPEALAAVLPFNYR